MENQLTANADSSMNLLLYTVESFLDNLLAKNGCIEDVDDEIKENWKAAFEKLDGQLTTQDTMRFRSKLYQFLVEEESKGKKGAGSEGIDSSQLAMGNKFSDFGFDDEEFTVPRKPYLASSAKTDLPVSCAPRSTISVGHGKEDAKEEVPFNPRKPRGTSTQKKPLAEIKKYNASLGCDIKNKSLKRFS